MLFNLIGQENVNKMDRNKISWNESLAINVN